MVAAKRALWVAAEKARWKEMQLNLEQTCRDLYRDLFVPLPKRLWDVLRGRESFRALYANAQNRSPAYLMPNIARTADETNLVTKLEALLDSADQEVRLGAIMLLGVHGDQNSFNLLQSRYSHESGLARTVMAVAMIQLRPDLETEQFQAICEGLSKSNISALRSFRIR
jgi:hypothetical protein